MLLLPSDTDGIDVPALEKRLGFTLNDAMVDPHRCVQMVPFDVWERDVVTAIIRITLKNGPLLDAKMVRSKVDNITEVGFGLSYEQSIDIGRAHRAIAVALMEGGGWSFESDWISIPSELREYIVLCALIRSTVEGGEGFALRLGAFDLTVESLCRDQGRPVIDLVRRIVRSGLRLLHSYTHEYEPIRSPEWDRYLSIERRGEESSALPLSREDRQQQVKSLLARNLFIAKFVQNVLAIAFAKIGMKTLRETPIPLVRKPLFGGAVWDDPTRMRKESILSDSHPSSSEVSDILQGATWEDEMAEKFGWKPQPQKPEIEQVCRCCTRFANEVEELVYEVKPLSYCAPCRRLDPPQLIAYCSTDCQKKDWVTEHRLYCGKSFADIELVDPFTLTPPEPPLSLPLQMQLHGTSPASRPIRPAYLLKLPVSMTSDDGKKNLVARVAISGKHTRLARVLIDRAVATRRQEDIRAVVGHIVRAFLEPNTPREDRESAFAQLSEEWDVDVNVVAAWALKTICEEFKVAGSQ